jgi:hypothetical protein
VAVAPRAGGAGHRVARYLVEVAAGFVTWLGASLVVLGDGRRGLALGVAVATAGLAALAWQASGPVPAAALAAGGGLAAAGRLRTGAPGWRIMPAGSTPRIVLCVAAALVALWVALAVTTGPGAGLRFAALACLVLAPARILWSDDPPIELAAAAVLALAVGSASALGSSAPDAWPLVAAAGVAAGIGWMPRSERHAG